MKIEFEFRFQNSDLDGFLVFFEGFLFYDDVMSLGYGKEEEVEEDFVYFSFI